MTAPDLLRSVVGALDAAGIPFMLTGSLAAAVHGAARATMDIDLVIDATADQLQVLVAALGDGELYVSPEAALEALRHESMFNVVDTTTGWKADLIVRKSRPFSRTEFARRRHGEYEGTRLWVTTVEDLIIAKLEWAKLGGSARQIEVSPSCCASRPSTSTGPTSIAGLPISISALNGRRRGRGVSGATMATKQGVGSATIRVAHRRERVAR